MKTGDKIPSVKLKRLNDAGNMEEIDFADYIKDRKVVMFALPGAFTPACAQKHLPGYIEQAKEIKAQGIDEIICMAVNDPFVMKHWGEVAGAQGKVTMMPDGNADFAKAVGMDIDLSGAGLATRSKRYSSLINKGVVERLNVEMAPSDVEFSSATSCVAWFR